MTRLRSERDAPGRPVLRLVRPIQEFIHTEASGGIVLLAAAIAALVWANSPWSDDYHRLVEQHLVLDLGFYRVDESLHFWVTDGAMVIFFFLVGLEIKREAVVGELASLRRLVVPLCGALGGMLVPMLLFLAVVQGGDAARGWGIPMATDIAFALGVLALLGPRIPAGLKVVLLAIAIVDDVGAIIVIAVFYAESVAWLPIFIALAMLGLAWVLRSLHVWYVGVYLALALVAWGAMLKSGVHPTLVGVAFGLLTPWRSLYPLEQFVALADPILDRFRGPRHADPRVVTDHEEDVEDLLSLAEISRHTVAPLDRLEHELHPVGAYVVVPAFAFVNAGVTLSGDTLTTAVGGALPWGIVLGLAVGKPLGIMLGTWLVVLAGATLPTGVRWSSLLGVTILAGIGFTVSLLIADLAYVDEALLTQAKIGIMAASLLAGVVGYLYLRFLLSPRAELVAAESGAETGEVREPAG